MLKCCYLYHHNDKNERNLYSHQIWFVHNLYTLMMNNKCIIVLIIVMIMSITTVAQPQPMVEASPEDHVEDDRDEDRDKINLLMNHLYTSSTFRTTPMNSKPRSSLLSSSDRMLQRLPTDDSSCSNVCSDGGDTDSLVSSEESDDNSGGVLNVVTNFIGRFFNNLFKSLFPRPTEQPTDENTLSSAVPALSNYSAKSSALTKLLRDEQRALLNDPTLNKDQANILDMMYNISSLNMELLSSAVDPMILTLKQSTNQQQQPVDFLRSIGCQVTQVVSLVQTTTLPTIELMVEVLYTKMGDDDMKKRYRQYATTKSGKDTVTRDEVGSSLTKTDTCLEATPTGTIIAKSVDVSSTSRLFFGLYYNIVELFFPNPTDGPIIHILRIIGLLIIFPLAIVVGIITFIPYIISALIFGYTGSFVFLILTLLLLNFFNFPFLTFALLRENIRDLIRDILYGIDRSRTDAPTPAPVVRRQVRAMAEQQQGSSTSNIGDVIDHMLLVLNSPIDKVAGAVEDLKTSASSYSSSSESTSSATMNEDEVNCEVSILCCQNDGLLKTLPF